MPELPEVQTTATSLQPLLNQTVQHIAVYQPKLRFGVPDDLASLIDYQLIDVKRRAKYLLLTFAQGTCQKQLLIHLGMSGSLQQHPRGFAKRKHDHVIMTFGNNFDQVQLHYHDPRRFGMVLWLNDYADKLMNHLGIEPLSDAFSGEYLYQYIHGRKNPITRPIKSVIMAQEVVVGVGNIYATESLFLAKIHPLTPAHLLTVVQLNCLACHIRFILTTAISQGGSTLKDFTVADGQTGYFQQTLLVYGHKGAACPSCGTVIDSVKINQRASTFCPTCQPLPVTVSSDNIKASRLKKPIP